MKGNFMLESSDSPYAYDGELAHYRKFKTIYICVRCELEYVKFQRVCICCKLPNVIKISNILDEITQKIKKAFWKSHINFPSLDDGTLCFNEKTKTWEISEIKLREKLRIFLKERDLND